MKTQPDAKLSHCFIVASPDAVIRLGLELLRTGKVAPLADERKRRGAPRQVRIAAVRDGDPHIRVWA